VSRAIFFVLLAACTPAPQFPDALVKFTALPIGPALEPRPGRWDERFEERGWVMHDDEGYWLWYAGQNTDPGGALGVAWSRDGLHFDRLTDEPIYDEHLTEDIQVFKHDGLYYAVTEGLGDEAQWLVSPDRMHWTRPGAIDVRKKDGTPLDVGPLGTPNIVVEGDLWYLLYERMDNGIWLAVSSDHHTFLNVQDDPVIPLGPGAYDEARVSLNQVIKYGDRWYGFYNAQGRGPKWTTAVASSPDLVHWDKYEGNPILDDIIAVVTPEPDGFRLYSMNPVVKVYASKF
jgi:hypothetical protein